ncbi:MAG: 2-oxo acid dehydrogenase subunit E2, partial [Gemmataceae bacterium]|nr:2-oxo acid dehydrogenase subunit E2 [Gemmataceae bacterium]
PPPPPPPVGGGGGAGGARGGGRKTVPSPGSLGEPPSPSRGEGPSRADAPSPPPAPAAGGKSQFKLPSLGEGIDAATVTAVLVKAGDAVQPGHPVVGVETDKAAMEVEADTAGTVEQVHVKPGDKIGVGTVILTLTGAGGGRPAAVSGNTGGTPVPQEKQPADAGRSPAAGKPTVATTSAGVAPGPSGNGTGPKVPAKEPEVIPAGPATRRLARELGVGLGELTGSGRGGRVTVDDIKAFVKDERQRTKTAGGSPGAAGAGLSGRTVADSFAHPPHPDFGKFGEVERKPVAGIRQTIARNLTVAWRTMPMVTQHDLADITELEAGRKRIVDALPKGSPKITMTVLALKACVAALREFPQFNSSYDMNAGELVVKKYYHLGIAVDTERGLVVPVIRDADKKSIRDLAAEMTALAEKARAGKLGLDEMRGGTFTVTNLGGIGGTSFTPIVNYPEVAILGMSRSALQPVVRDGQVVPRLMLPLSLTYDHRVIDGADGARFTSRLAQLFSDPLRLLMET